MTILERLTATFPDGLGLSEERAREHLRSEFVRVDGETVTDPELEVTAQARLTLQPPPVTEQV